VYHYPLFERYPPLAAELPVAGLLQQATPLQPLPDCDRVWIKRDDLSASDYGGNKVRKLDLLLARARADGKRSLLSFGYAGSNFVAATAWHGRKLGLETHAFLLPQADASYVADNLAIGRHAGARYTLGHSDAALVAKAFTRSASLLLQQGRSPRWIPPGGATALGSIGFVNAAFELQQQIERGLMPTPQWLYVAFSSMGTVAGLSLGLALAGLGSVRIQAVQVVGPRYAGAEKLQRLQQAIRRQLAPQLPQARHCAAAAVEIRKEFFGSAYAVPTAITISAMQRFAATSGARSDSAYSGKALACLYHDLAHRRAAGPVLYWHTCNAHARPPGVAALTAEELRACLGP
jgi:1-aminocyclopropane-1-carboxylate deaminase/D-cysteine desulfhydrase-like pyridoxal-dependent ACC family enzyme